MWISSNLLKLTIYFVGSCCQLCRVSDVPSMTAIFSDLTFPVVKTTDNQ